MINLAPLFTNMKKIIQFVGLIAIIGFSFIQVKAQDAELSTQGKVFWLTFMENIQASGAVELKIVISGNKACNGTIKNLNTSQTRTFSLPAGGGVDTILIPTSMGYCVGSETTSDRNKGIIIESNDTISVSAQNSKNLSADAALIYPIEALGIDYRVVSFPGDVSTGWSSNSSYRSTFAIVATENNTVIDITPTCATVGGGSNGTTFTITLQKGETYHVKANTNKLDLSGTLIQARDCKKIAVFGGSNRSLILHPSCASGTNSYDHLYEQMMPINIWGKKFAFIPTIWDNTTVRRFEMIKFVTSQNSTTVRLNGRLKVLPTAGMTDTFYIVTNSTRPDGILISNKPIAVCQMLLSERCDGNASNTDPAMIWVPPMEQTLKKLNFSCERAQTINKFFINVVVKTQSRSQLLIDGVVPTATWKKIANDTSFSYIQQGGLTEGKHNMSHPVGFYAMLYAYGNNGSYGFNAGSSIKPLSFFSIINGKSSADFEGDSAFFSVCQGSNIPFEGGASSTTGVTWKWRIKPPTGASITKTTRTFSNIFVDTGQYNIQMIAVRAANGTCNGSATLEDTLNTLVKVYNKPIITLMKDTTICFGNSFNIKSKTDGDSNYVFSPPTWLSCTNCFEPTVTPLKDTAYYVVATRFGCLPSRDTLRVFIRDTFKFSTGADTTVCRGTNANLYTIASGGFSSNLKVHWSHNLGIGFNKTVNPKVTTTYTATLTDSCSLNGDGTYYSIKKDIKVVVYDSLKITMPNDTIVCEGNLVSFTPKIVGGRPGTTLLTWNNGLGTGTTKSYTMAIDSLIFKAVLSDGCTSPKDSGFVKVKVRPGIRIDSIYIITPVCKNELFSIKAKLSGGDSTGYNLRFFNYNTGSPVLIDSSKGKSLNTFNVRIKDDSKFRFTMKQGCNSQQVSSKIFDIKIKDNSTVSVPKSTDTICVGQNFSLVANGVSGNAVPIKFILQRRTGAVFNAIDSFVHSNIATFIVTPASNPTFYRIIGDDGCSRTDSTLFELQTRLPLALVPLVGDQLCKNEMKSLVANASGGKVQNYQYRWFETSNDNTLGQSKTLDYTPSQSMEIGIELNDGCSSPVNSKAVLNVAPEITTNILTDEFEGCETFSTIFNYPTTIGTAPINTNFTWKWYIDGVNTINTPSAGGQTHATFNKNYPIAGNYRVKVEMILSNGKICNTYEQDIEVWKQAVADFSWMPIQIDIVEPEVTFTNQSFGATQYNWMFSDGASYSTNDVKHSFTDTGVFNITLVASNINGCDSTITKSLRVLDIYRMFIPDAFSPNEDDVNTVWAPKFTSLKTIEVSVFNRWGEKIFASTEDGGKWDGKYNGKACEEGIYFYNIKVRDNRKKWHYYSGTVTLLR